VYLPIELSTSHDQSINPQEVIHKAVKKLLLGGSSATDGDDDGIDALIRKEIQDQMMQESKRSLGFLEESDSEEEDILSTLAVATTKEEHRRMNRSSSRRLRTARELPPRRHTVDERKGSRMSDHSSSRKKELPQRRHTEKCIQSSGKSNRRASYSMEAAEEMYKQAKSTLDASARKHGSIRRSNSLLPDGQIDVIMENAKSGKSPVKYNLLGSRLQQSLGDGSPLSPRARLMSVSCQSVLQSNKKMPTLATHLGATKTKSSHERRLTMSIASSMANHDRLSTDMDFSVRERGRGMDASRKGNLDVSRRGDMDRSRRGRGRVLDASRRGKERSSLSRSASHSRSRSRSRSRSLRSGSKRSKSRGGKTSSSSKKSSKEGNATEEAPTKRESIRRARSKSAGAAARSHARAKARREKLEKQQQKLGETTDEEPQQQSRATRPQRRHSGSVMNHGMNQSFSSGFASRRQRRQSLLNANQKKFENSHSTLTTESTFESSGSTSDHSKARPKPKESESLLSLYSGEPSSLLSGRKTRNIQNADNSERRQARAILDEAFQDLPSLSGMEEFHRINES
jgi:hypothetical protein